MVAGYCLLYDGVVGIWLRLWGFSGTVGELCVPYVRLGVIIKVLTINLAVSNKAQ